LDVAVNVRDILVVILEEKEIFELVAVSPNMIGDLVASEGVRLSVVVVELIGQAAKKAISIRVHAVDVGPMRKERLPNLLYFREDL